MCYTMSMMDLRAFSQKRICVAVSGGIDSVCLLHYLKAREKECGYYLSAVHCEHGIRGEESLADMRFVQDLCAKWGVPLFAFSEDCPARAKREKESLETAARNFRYERFSALIKENKTDYIATAHHKNDDAETVLFRLARGTSLSGAGGMYEMNGYLLRPFLGWTRAEIERYAAENDLSYRTDSTNGETDATRNKLRIEVLPKLEEAVHGAGENLVRFAKLASEDDALLYEYAEPLVSYTEDGVCVDFCEKKPLFRRACLLALKALGVGKDYTSTHLDNAYALQGAERGAKINLPRGIIAQKSAEGIFFYEDCPEPQEERGAEKPFGMDGFDGGRYEVKVSLKPFLDNESPWKTLRLDGEKLPDGAVFRFREAGDEMERFGGGRKTLKKVLNEEKIPCKERGYLPLIAKDKEVYAVCGVEISEKVKITESTKTVLYIQLRKKKKE